MPWSMDWRFLIQNSNPPAAALDPDCAFDDGAFRKRSPGFFAEPQSFIMKDHGPCIRHETANVAQLVACNRALVHGGQILRLADDSRLEDHDGVGGN